MTHNEALQLLDLVVAPAVEEAPRTSPPTAPVVGVCYLVGSPASGSWAGREHCVAGFTGGGWRFVTPPVGMITFVRDVAKFAVFVGGTWEIGIVRGSSVHVDGAQVVGSRAAAIAPPTGGSTIDFEARNVVTQILVALRSHGLIAT